MKIVICIKPVRGSLVYERNDDKSLQYIINPYDMFLLQQLKSLKQKSTIHTIVLCMGPEASNDILTKCLSMDIDEAYLLSDSCFAGSDTYVTSNIIAKAIQKIGSVDYVICGEKAIDGETGQIPYELSQRLGVQVYAGVMELCDVADDAMVVNCKNIERVQNLVIPSPAVLVGSEFSLTEYIPDFIKLKRARSKPRTVWNHEQLELNKSTCGLGGSKTQVVDCKRSVYKRERKLLEGESELLAKTVIDIIRNEYRENKS